MKVDRTLRSLLALLILLGFVLALAAALFVTESALNVWDRLRSGPVFVFWAYVAMVVLLSLAAVWLIWRFVLPRRSSVAASVEPAILTREYLEGRIEKAEAAGVDTRTARAELDRLERSGGNTTLGIVVFGEISTGKSSLIQALVPGAEAMSSPIGGSTTEARRYRWQSPAGVTVELIDLPGISGTDALGQSACDEALRSHIVIFVCEEDLSRQEAAALDMLLTLGKPTVVALNKADRFSDRERDKILGHLHELTLAATGDATVTVVPAMAGGEESVIEIDTAGRETRAARERLPDVGQLVVALNAFLRRDPEMLNALRNRAVFSLAAEKLSLEEDRFRQRRSGEIIRAYTKKAVIGALAAVSPGSDIVIQGYLATGMTKDLARLYELSPRDLDVEQFLDLSQGRVGKAIPLSLAVAGNGLKAFPGLGTVAGGLVHAVAYGLIFDALGRSLAQSLAAGRGFSASTAAAAFESSLNDSLEKRVQAVARLALSVGRPDSRPEA